MSKHPLVTTRRWPRARTSARQAAKAPQEINFWRKFTRQIVAELFQAWQSLSVRDCGDFNVRISLTVSCPGPARNGDRKLTQGTDLQQLFVDSLDGFW